MTADALKTITTDALDRLAALLDEGHSDQLTALLKTMARFHKYSWHNVALIASQRPTATRVAGFQTWRTMNRFVRKGEKGIAILAPIVGRREAESEGDNARTVRGFRAAYVFDLAQTDGDPLPELSRPAGEPGTALDRLRQAITAHGIRLEDADHLDGALGTSSGGCIRVLRTLPPPTTFSVLAHEFAHELLHHDGTTRPARDTRELEAEAVAFVVSHAVGLDALTSASDYVQLYHGDREALVQSLERIQRTANTIIRTIEPT